MMKNANVESIPYEKTKLEWEMNCVKKVRRIIDEADDTKAYLVFLSRNGIIDAVSDTHTEEVWIDLYEEAGAYSGGPFFGILSIADGVIIIDDIEFLTGVNEETLLDAVRAAGTGREIFYADRAKEFGMSAYPAGMSAYPAAV